MAETNNTSEPRRAINLKILSPNTEVGDELNFESIPLVTTVFELKRTIQTTLSTHPPTERMRLIHLGKVLANPDETLERIFGAKVQQTADHKLHLVLRPLPDQIDASRASMPNNRPTSVPPNPFRPSDAPQPAQPQTNPFRAQAMIPNPPQRPQTQPPPPHGHNEHAHPHAPQFPFVQGGANNAMPFPPFAAPPWAHGQQGPMAPDLNHIMLQQLAAQAQEQVRQMQLLQAQQLQHLNEHGQQHGQARQQENGTHIPPEVAAPANAPSPAADAQAQYLQRLSERPETQGRNPTVDATMRVYQAPRAAATQLVESVHQEGQVQQTQTNGVGASARNPDAGNVGGSETLNGPAQAQPGNEQQPPPQPQEQDAAGVPPNAPRMPVAVAPPGVNITQQGFGPNGQHWSFTVAGGTMMPHPTQGPEAAMLPVTNHLLGAGRNTPFLQPHHHQQIRNQAMMDRAAGLATTPPPGYPRPPIRLVSPAPVGATPENINRLRSALERAHNAIENVRVLMQSLLDRSATDQSGRSNERRMRQLYSELDALGLALDTTTAMTQSITGVTSSQNQRVRPGVGNMNMAAMENAGFFRPENAALMRTPGGPAILAARASQQQASSAPASGPQAPTSTQMYMLSGPRGPYALLQTPRGNYQTNVLPASWTGQATSAPQEPTGGNNDRQMLRNMIHEAAERAAQAQERINQAGPPRAWVPGEDQNPPQAQAVAPAGGQAGAQAQRNPEQNLFAVVLGHIWLLIRVLGFIYLFSGGSGWRRPALLSLLGLVVIAANAGIFGQWPDRIRRHFEGILQMNVQGRPGEQPAQQGQQGAGQAQGAGGQPQPADAAQRLLRERQERDQTWLRQQLRGVERAVTLFVASLWPGIGERMIRAREEAEAEDRRREAEAQQQAAQAQAEQQQAIEAAQPAPDTAVDRDADRKDAPATAGDVAGSSSGVQAQAGSSVNEGGEARRRRTESQDSTAD